MIHYREFIFLSSSTPKLACQLVIVGGGYGGVQLAVQLDSYCKVVLIDPKDAFHHNVGALRAIVEPAFIKKTLITYEEMLTHGSFIIIKDRVASCNVSRKTVTLAGGEEINYMYVCMTILCLLVVHRYHFQVSYTCTL